jgi:selenocysteine lyase/cysteine desulfurase
LAYSLTGILEYFCDLASHLVGVSQTKPSQQELLKIAFTEIAKYEEKLSETLISYLTSKKEVTIIGTSEFSSAVRVPTSQFIY